MLPYDFDALLPTAERFRSERFRSVAWKLSYKLLSWDDAVALVAFVESIGGAKYARYIFHWRGNAQVRAYHRLKRHVGADAHDAIRANEAAMSVDVGLAVLKAMQDGGWTGQRYSPVVKRALKDLRKRGVTIAKIARLTGLTREQVKTACDVRTHRNRVRQAGAYGALAVGF